MKTLAWTLSLFGFFVGAMSASATPENMLSWQACVELTVKNNADLQSAQSAFRSAEYLEGSARSGFLPEISGSINATQANGRSDLSTSSATDSYGASVSASQNLFSGFQDLGRVRQAKANTKNAQATLQIAKARVSYNLKTSFESYSYAKEYSKLAQDIVRRRQEDLNLVQLRFQSGRENRGSVLLSKAYFEQAKYDELVSRNLLTVARSQLAQVIGLDEDETLDVSDNIPIQDLPNRTVEFKSLALDTPDHAQALANTESADAGITVAAASFYPSLSLVGNMGKLDNTYFPQSQEHWSVGLNLTIPFFSGFKDYYSTKSAIYQSASALSNQVNTDRGLLPKLKEAYNNLTEAIAKLKVDASFREAANLRAEIARKKYNNGLQTFEDWDVIESDLINRQKTYLQSKRDRVVTEAAWEQAQGKGVIP